MYLTGVLQSLGMVFITAIFNIYIKYCVDVYNINPVFFAFVYFIFTSWILLIIAGPGKFSMSTIKDLSTWFYGFMLIALSAVNLYLIKYVSGTELSILSRSSVVIAVASSFFIFRKKIKIHDIINTFFIGISVAIILYIQNSNYIIILQITALAALIQFLQFFIAEAHKQSQDSHENGDLRDRLRVTAFATFVTTFIFFVFTVFISFFAKNNLNIYSSFPFIPKIEDFSHMPTVISAALFAVFLSPFMRYFQWSAAYKIKTSAVLTILALTPLITFLLEYIASYIGIINAPSIFTSSHGLVILLVTLFITFGSLLSTYLNLKPELSKTKGKTLKEKISNALKVKSEALSIGHSANSIADYEIVRNTIDFYEGDEQKAADKLCLPLDTVKTLVITKNAYSLRDDVSKKVHEIFRNEIFYLDQLTGVENKKGLIRQFAEYQDQGIDFNLFYMDINKFKQINDTLGHEIGDVAIIASVHRIRDYAKQNNGFAYRLGGDEFAMLTTTTKPEEQVVAELKDLISQPISYELNGKKESLNPSISIGKANVIKDSEVKIKDLISSADENMYKDKNAIVK